MINPLRPVRAFTSLAFDAVEALAFLFDFSDPADKIWAEACDRLSDKGAQEEVGESALDRTSRLAQESLKSAFWPHGSAYDGWPDAERARKASSASVEPRVIKDRGLGPDERDGEWIDVDGDHWRYDHEAGSWQNKMSRGDIATTWYNVPALDDGTISAIYAPFIEVIPSSPADGLAHSAVPLAEDGPAGPEIRAHSPAGPPTLTCDDFMDAARAAHEKGNSIDHPNFAAHGDELAERLEVAAISAAPARISVKK